MVTATLSEDRKWIYVDGNIDEISNIRLDFTKKINSWFIIKKKYPDANIEETFMNHLGMIPAGLWMELINTCKAYNYYLMFCDDFNDKIKNPNINREIYDEYMNNLFSGDFKPRDYQLDAVYNMLLYMNCCVEISTSGGKTLMSYMLFKYMKEQLGVKHILFVTPKTNLTTQSYKKFLEYDEKNGVVNNWTCGEIHATAKKKDEYNDDIVFGNYQSLVRKKKEFFEKFDCIIIDEAHHAPNTSCRTILKRCVNATYKIGMTGTFPKDGTIDSFVLQSYIGPIVYRLTSHELINEKKSATPVHVNVINMKYLDDEKLQALYTLRNVRKSDDPTIGGKILDAEKDVAREDNNRLSFICNMIKKTTKNSLVIFTDIKTEYGKSIYNYLREDSDKTVYYIDGNTTTSLRDKIKQAMEDDLDQNTIVVASIGCFSEGIDIANMWNIFLVESTKSDNIMAQLLGRGMRTFSGKDKTVLIDFVDDFRYGSGFYMDNYLFKHGKERIEIYCKRGFPCNVVSVDLNKINI